MNGNSVSTMVGSVFPEHKWEIDRFAHKPHDYWESPVRQRAFLALAASRLGFAPTDLERWYKVRARELQALGGEVLLQRYGKSVSKLLATVFPEHKWDLLRFQNKPKSFWE